MPAAKKPAAKAAPAKKTAPAKKAAPAKQPAPTAKAPAAKAPAKRRGPRVALFVADIYNDFELWVPFYRLKEAGAEVVVAGPAKGEYKSKHGLPCVAGAAFRDLKAADFDALVIPGGYAPDIMRRSKEALAFTAAMDKAGKPVAFICHAGWVPASAGILKGRTVTSYFAIKDDLVHAGANWVDQEVVVDKNLITSRTPADLPAFCKTLVAALGLA
ncbi:MAG: type 1 glutamine amidotransferase domain-containing protein [Thermodesulfobacteriota bacterium]